MAFLDELAGYGSRVRVFDGDAGERLDLAAWLGDPRPGEKVYCCMGIHQCVGQHIARLEGEALLTALASRADAIELAAPPRRHLNNTLRALESLPVRLHLA